MNTRKTKQLPKWLAAIAMVVVTFVGTATAQTVTYIHTDALGSPVAETDASGNVIKRLAYEPYGAVVSGEVTDGPGYTGHVSDAATGLSYMQQRYMDPELGVFLSVDPIDALSDPISSFGRYVYANQNPYSYFDPDGRQACGKDTGCRLAQGDAGGSIGNIPRAASGQSVATSSAGRWDELQSRLGLKGDLTKNGNILDYKALAHDIFYPLMDTPEGVPLKAGGLLVVKIGRAGEDAVRGTYNIGSRGYFWTGWRLRFPDGMTSSTLSEVKNVKTLSYTSQLRDYSQFAKSSGRRFDLYVRRDTVLSRPLLNAINEGDVALRYIP